MSDMYEGDGGFYCNGCLEERAPKPIYGYHDFRRPLVKHGNGRLAGFELEAGKTDERKMRDAANAILAMDDDHQHYHCEQDGSIPYHGFELVSMPHDIVSHRAYDWFGVLDVMARHGMKSNSISGCGLHVHVDKTGLRLVDLAKIDIFVAHNRPWFELLARRNEASYAAYKSVQHGQWGRSSGRYQAVNFLPRNTVEFRLWKGTLNLAVLLACIELSVATVEFCKQAGVMALLKGKGAVAGFKSFLAAGNYPAAVAYVAKMEAKQAALAAGKKVA